jgi:hypothetical protein
MMHIPPKEFWNMSFIELSFAIQGFQEFNGAKPPPMQSDELQEMMEVYPD